MRNVIEKHEIHYQFEHQKENSNSEKAIWNRGSYMTKERKNVSTTYRGVNGHVEVYICNWSGRYYDNVVEVIISNSCVPTKLRSVRWR